jgi:hypothetical protein
MEDPPRPYLQGICFYDEPVAQSPRPYLSPPSPSSEPHQSQLEPGYKACVAAINAKMSLVALGLEECVPSQASYHPRYNG